MSLFRRGDSSSPSASSGGSSDLSSAPSHSSSAPKAERRRVTHIAPGTRVQGLLSGPTELLIEGEVEGEIRVDASVMIGADGVVKGPVTANNVRVGGRVEGNVQAVERVEVAPSGSLEGDIAAPRVVIAEGAFFKGRVEMRPDRGGKSEKSEKTERQEKVPERPQERPPERPDRQERTEQRASNDRRGRGEPVNGVAKAPPV
jgi:cytoskeletal protein CcmA (bactofilin family)